MFCLISLDEVQKYYPLILTEIFEHQFYSFCHTKILSKQEAGFQQKWYLYIHDPIQFSYESPPPNGFLPVLEKIKSVYILWHAVHTILPQVHRYTLGNRIDKMFIEIIEAVSTAAFLSREEKLPFVRLGIRKLDTLKILLMVLWETNSINDKKYIALSLPLDEIGRMLGGWFGQLIKQNSPIK